MGKLNIAHHKSYHPYRRDNIERVRRDEEEARLKEAKEEGRMRLADSEARIDLLRQRTGIDVGREILRESDDSQPEPAVLAAGQLPTTNGHINLFHDIEQNMVAALTTVKKVDTKASERGFKLAPDEKELKRWYTQRRTHDDPQPEEDDEDKSKRDAQRKYRDDPLTTIEQRLASRSSSSSTQPHQKLKPRHSYPSAIAPLSSSSTNPSVQARLQRESSERERALALIQRKKREMEGNMTPSTVYGDDDGYGDVYNRREVQDAHRGRERRKHRDRRRDW